MLVRRLALHDFRNIADLAIEPEAGLNLVVGPNAQGKTSLLESLHVLATTKSHRTARDVELVRFGAPATRCLTTIERGGSSAGETADLEVAIAAAGSTEPDRKRVRIDGVRQNRTVDLLGRLQVVLFSVNDVDMVRGEPTERRRFLDYAISQVSPRYALALGAYRKALEQRNRLLKDVRRRAVDADSLDAWSEALAVHGARIVERRADFLARLAPHAAAMHGLLSDGVEKLTVAYKPSFALPAEASVEAAVDAFREALARVRSEEIARGTTLAGPQRDDVMLSVGNGEGQTVEVRNFGSQGQQRTAALALRMAERVLAEELSGDPPVVLLDDVLSDLDERRRSQVLAHALQRGGQTFLTTTETSVLPPDTVDAARVWRLRAGRIETA
ncbi:MAG: DNA replication/repair protein RecF [Armatimonadota bacterium]